MFHTLVLLAALSAPAAPVLAAGALEEIIVTAHKREENSQTLGLSISVLDAATLRDLNLVSLPDAADYLGNVELFEDFLGAGVPTWVIRGVGLQDFNTNNTPTAAVYFDESYQSSVVMGAAALFDVERLEVLKGPQGGMYGRNTSGGAVLLNSRRAVLGERSGHASATLSSWRTRQLDASVNLPLASNLALRVAGRGNHSDGAWQRSLVDGAEHGRKDAWDLRSWLNWQVGDDLSVEWKLQAGRDQSEIGLGRALGLYAADGGLCPSIVAGQRDDANCLSWSGVNQLRQGRAPSPVSLQARDGSYVSSDPINALDNDYQGSLLELRKSLGRAEFRSITSIDRFRYGVALDLDATTGEYGHRFSLNDIRQIGQEFRLASNAPGRLEWLLGLVWNEERFEERRDFLGRDNILVPLGRGRLEYDQDSSSQAAYGSLSFALADAWSLNAALRYTREEKEYENGNFYLRMTPPLYYLRDHAGRYALSDRWSGRLGLDWAASDTLLIYGAVSRGFKSGGFFGGFPFDQAEVQPYGEETITAYELGLKSDLGASLRLNLALFHYDYRDVQGYLRELNPVTGSALERLANQGDARHDGAELQLTWQPSERFGLNLELGYLDAAFVREGLLTRGVDRRPLPIGGRRPFAPRWSVGSSAFLAGRLGAYPLRASLGYHYRSEFSGELARPSEQAVYHLPGYGLFDGRLSVMSRDERISLALWARNLLDESYRTRIKSDGVSGYAEFFGEPRSLGLTLDYTW